MPFYSPQIENSEDNSDEGSKGKKDSTSIGSLFNHKASDSEEEYENLSQNMSEKILSNLRSKEAVRLNEFIHSASMEQKNSGSLVDKYVESSSSNSSFAPIMTME